MAPTVAWAGGRSTGRHCAPGSGTRGDGARPGWRLGQQRPACHPHACSPAAGPGPGTLGTGSAHTFPDTLLPGPDPAHGPLLFIVFESFLLV